MKRRSVKAIRASVKQRSYMATRAIIKRRSQMAVLAVIAATSISMTDLADATAKQKFSDMETMPYVVVDDGAKTDTDVTEDVGTKNGGTPNDLVDKGNNAQWFDDGGAFQNGGFSNPGDAQSDAVTPAAGPVVLADDPVAPTIVEQQYPTVVEDEQPTAVEQQYPGVFEVFGNGSEGNGANVSGPYDPTGVGSNQPGAGNGGAIGMPDAGTVGNADDKNPPGQQPGGNDENLGYECEDKPGIGNGNPAHTSCVPPVEEPPAEEPPAEEPPAEEPPVEEPPAEEPPAEEPPAEEPPAEEPPAEEPPAEEPPVEEPPAEEPPAEEPPAEEPPAEEPPAEEPPAEEPPAEEPPAEEPPAEEPPAEEPPAEEPPVEEPPVEEPPVEEPPAEVAAVEVAAVEEPPAEEPLAVEIAANEESSAVVETRADGEPLVEEQPAANEGSSAVEVAAVEAAEVEETRADAEPSDSESSAEVVALPDTGGPSITTPIAGLLLVGSAVLGLVVMRRRINS
jgi:hypothetical protein